ncbi:hypothetical protein [Nonomuraea sp. bgisy101]|uniref:hypothetical protein n=1 Tax=Nonomuraea sp. bgisy101 TaxID=3413784 RepID=UPI003D748DC9
MGETRAAGPAPRVSPDVLREALDRHPLVNLTGPLGIGKSRLVSSLASVSVLDLSQPDALEAVPAALAEDTRAPLALDSADSPDALSALEAVRARRQQDGRPVLVVSRRSLLAHPKWTLSGATVLRVSAWEDERIRKLAADAQLHAPQSQDLVVRLAAGNPLIAGAACRALHAGASPHVPGTVADQITQEIIERLSRELPAQRWRGTLDRLATMWSGDEALLQADPEVFDALRGLSVVARTELGLAVVEPFRSVIELAHRWRQPTAHRGTRTRALAYRKRLLATEPSAEHRSRLAESVMALSDDDAVRETLFPASSSTGLVHTADPGDADDIGELMHWWARSGGLDTRRTDRMVEQWLRDDPSGFQLLRDGDGRAAGLIGLLHVAERTVPSVESLLQEHADGLFGRPRGAGSLVLGAAYCPDRGLHAFLLRHLLHQVRSRGLLLTVSTPNPDYQRLLRGLRFRRHGTTTDDIYRCGRRPEIYSQDFGRDALPDWVERLVPVSDGVAPQGPTGRDVGWALARIRDEAGLADSPLLACARTATVMDLQEWLRDAVRTLEDGDSPEDAEAGWILRHYYLGRPRTHQQLALQLHISRATYFRRLHHGLDTLGRLLSTEDS